MRRNRLIGLLLALLLLAACAPLGSPISSPGLSPAPMPESTLVPIFDVRVQWQTPDQAYDNTPWWQGTPCFYGEPLQAMVPSPDYRFVYPYVGGMVYDQYGGGRAYKVHSWKNELYGLCTAAGEIITAPIYSSYFRFTDGEHIANLLYNTAGEKSALDDQPCILYPPDGSWVLEFESVLMHQNVSVLTEGFFFVDVGFLAVKKDGLWGTVGYDGQIIEPLIHETPELLYRARTTDENGHEWHWYGDEVFFEVWYANDGLNSVIHIGQTEVEDYHHPLVLDVVYIYLWDEDEAERMTLCYDKEGNFLSKESDQLYWDLSHSISRWVEYSIDEETGAITSYAWGSDEHDGVPIITVRPATSSTD